LFAFQEEIFSVEFFNWLFGECRFLKEQKVTHKHTRTHKTHKHTEASEMKFPLTAATFNLGIG